MAKKALLSGILILTPIGGILAQDGLVATFGVTQQLEYVGEQGFSTPQDEGLRAVTGLSFGLSSQNSNQQFDFGLTGGLVLSDQNSSFDIENPSARLLYGISSRDTALTFNANYRRADVDQSNFFEDNIFLDPTVFSDEGTRTVASLRTGLELGRTAPVSYSFNHIYAQTSYDDTLDPALRDNTTQGLDGRVNFRLNGAVSTYVFASWREIDEDGINANDSTTTRYGVGGSFQVSPVLSLTTELNYSDSETTNSGVTSGLGYSLGLLRDLPNGSLGGSISATETINGTRTQARISRAMEFKRGSATFGIGASRTAGLSTEPLVEAALNFAISEVSNIGVNLSQASSISTNDQETINTRLGINYSRELTALSSISGGIQYAEQDVLVPGGIDQSSISANLTYRHDVGQDWDLISGYRYTSSRRDDRADRDSSTVFLGLEKTFSFRP